MTRAERDRRSALPVSRNAPVYPTIRIPAHLQDHSVEPLYTGVKKGRVRNRVGMWGNLSPYYSNGVTIDARWNQTVQNTNV